MSKELSLILTLLSPVIGGLIYGFERIVRARMQNRQGPPLLQPFYDFLKLMDKRSIMIHSFHAFMGIMYLVGTWFSLYVLLSGGDILIAIFFHVLSLAFLVVGGFSVRSPYSVVGAMRELIHMLAYEPIFVLTAAGLYLVTGTFQVSELLKTDTVPILSLPLVFIAFILSLPAVLKKSPFDIAEAHQEIIGGPEIEYSGKFYEAVYTAKWIEYIYAFFFVFLFAGSNYLLGAILVVLSFFIVNLIDNSTARVTFRQMVSFHWYILIPLVVINLMLLALWRA
ncbi:respiratory-chain NADH dehydrogenase subunit 1 [Desulfurobacterium thermolithotrophum DSM 11699]|uniref:Respiratory-chain NADH dehydrogenase subunit 1 n=1 Tax=Desulfurobacterium thermolithotrophum (strain DSM 11699 / BSA) TaxID=868864 RepID=F0S3G7_DESTD|nr:complex I subunit 1 family protein [Desulfurobacterium thermolithotrophum]ADY73389.1 respiratory-chain NADH dehydrogenase subunit 1 [Desulfurobacterium thermolithotrophum DSM 11699]